MNSRTTLNCIQSLNSDITETPEVCFRALWRSINTSGLALTAQSVRLMRDLEGTLIQGFWEDVVHIFWILSPSLLAKDLQSTEQAPWSNFQTSQVLVWGISSCAASIEYLARNQTVSKRRMEKAAHKTSNRRCRTAASIDDLKKNPYRPEKRRRNSKARLNRGRRFLNPTLWKPSTIVLFQNPSLSYSWQNILLLAAGIHEHIQNKERKENCKLHKEELRCDCSTWVNDVFIWLCLVVPVIYFEINGCIRSSTL